LKKGGRGVIDLEASITSTGERKDEQKEKDRKQKLGPSRELASGEMDQWGKEGWGEKGSEKLLCKTGKHKKHGHDTDFQQRQQIVGAEDEKGFGEGMEEREYSLDVFNPLRDRIWMSSDNATH